MIMRINATNWRERNRIVSAFLDVSRTSRLYYSGGGGGGGAIVFSNV